MNNKSTFLNNCFEWLFSDAERRTISFIITFFLIILISLAISLFVVAIDRHMQGWVGYLFP